MREEADATDLRRLSPSARRLPLPRLAKRSVPHATDPADTATSGCVSEAAPPPAAWASGLVARLHRQLLPFIEAIGFIGLAVALVGASGLVLAANRPFAGLTPSLVRKSSGRVRLRDAAAGQAIEDAMAEVLGRVHTGPRHASPRAIPIRGDNGKLVALAYFVPLTGSEVEVRVAGLLVVCPMRSCSVPNPQVLQRLFSLSPAEARVACGIAAARTVAAIAADFGVSRETVRSQLKTAMAKTGAKRQLDLAVLVSGLQVLKV